MNSVFISTSAFGSSTVLEKGQGFYLSVIEKSGGDGVEIRKELFSPKDSSLRELKRLIEEKNLISVYSAPLTIWNHNGELNENGIISTVREAIELGSKFVKFSLGGFSPSKSSVNDLKKTLFKLDIESYNLQVTVENDQTECGGNITILNKFLEECSCNGVSIGMTFDIGNWSWTGQDVYEAAVLLSKYVVYIHFKHIEVKLNQRVTLPLPIDHNSKWRGILAVLPQYVPRAIEFPIYGRDLEQVTSQYVQLLANA